MGVSNRRELAGVPSGTRRCRELDTVIPLARMPDSSNSYSTKERRAKMSFSSKHPPMALVKASCRSTYAEYVNES